MQEEVVREDKGQRETLLNELSVHLLRKFGTGSLIRAQIGVEVTKLAERRQITLEVPQIDSRPRTYTR